MISHLKSTKHEGLMLNSADGSFKVRSDSDFCGKWGKLTSSEDASACKLRAGHEITYAGFSVLCNSEIQTHVALSATEAECIASSQALRDAIPIMQLMLEIEELGCNVCSTVPKVTCKVFEDNEGSMELARFPKMIPRTKHINQMHHHFRSSYVSNGNAEIFKVQIVCIFAKPLPKEQFQKLLLKLMGF